MFFTTKPLGQGTGLGLSMIHGFVRQSGGQVRVLFGAWEGHHHEHVLTPRFSGEFSEDERPEATSIDRGDGERVLVIDDEAAIRWSSVSPRLATELSRRRTVRIVQAGGRILLITDVGLPNGLAFTSKMALPLNMLDLRNFESPSIVRSILMWREHAKEWLQFRRLSARSFF